MNNFISALLQIGWSGRTGVRDVGQAPKDFGHVNEADKQQNLVIICSPKSNALAGDLQQELKKIYPRTFVFESTGNQCFVTDGTGIIPSPSYQQMESYKKNGVPDEELPSQKYEDYAVITKVTNPWNPAAKVLWLAGIRGIGTWGAAECIKKEWQKIYDQLPDENKTCNFSALLKVNYDNCDISAIEVRRVEVLTP